MSTRMKPLEEQVIVITGASSGIGLATAELAAERGARVVLVARNEDKLREVEDRLRGRGCDVMAFPADVSRPEELAEAARAAVVRFGGIDTWVNNAAESIYGPAEQVTDADAHRLFDVNYFGVVNGCKAALPALRARGRGTLINVGSVASDVAQPLQSHYSATKHAVKGFTDALRIELEEEGVPIALSLIKPASINTPLIQHSKNYLEWEPDWPPPVYAPEVVARAILACAERPRRDVLVGGSARALSAAGHHGHLADAELRHFVLPREHRGQPGHRGERALYEPMWGESPSRWGDYEGHVARHSVYTGAALHPLRTTLALAAFGAGLGLALFGRRAARPEWEPGERPEPPPRALRVREEPEEPKGPPPPPSRRTYVH